MGTLYGEYHKKAEDKIKTGKMLGGATYNLSGAILLWRGALMKSQWIADYEAEVGKTIRLPGNTSTSRRPKTALGFALDKAHKSPDMIPVLFVILCRNYQSPEGIFMNNSAYTAYCHEGEFLLMEGFGVWVLAVKHGVKITNGTKEMEKYNG